MKLKKFEKKPYIPAPSAAEVVVSQPDGDRFRFNPETIISEPEWKQMVQDIKECRGHGWTDFIKIAYHVAVLFPDRIAELGIREDDFERLYSDIQRHQSLGESGNWYQISRVMKQIAAIFPEHRDVLSISADNLVEIRGTVREDSRISTITFTNQPANFTMVFPEYRAELGIDDGDWDYLQGQINRTRHVNWFMFANIASNMRILFPDRHAELGLTDDDWQQMQAALDRFREQDVLTFMKMAYYMSILSANEIQFTNKTIRLRHASEIPETPSLPERKAV